MLHNSRFIYANVGNIFITHNPCREKNRHTYRESQKNVVPRTVACTPHRCDDPWQGGSANK